MLTIIWFKKWAKELNNYFSKEDMQMANTQEKLLNIINHQGNANQYHREYHLVIVWLAVKKVNDNRCWECKMQRKGNLHLPSIPNSPSGIDFLLWLIKAWPHCHILSFYPFSTLKKKKLPTLNFLLYHLSLALFPSHWVDITNIPHFINKSMII